MKKSSPASVNIMANVFLIKEAAFIFKEIGGWVFLK